AAAELLGADFLFLRPVAEDLGRPGDLGDPALDLGREVGFQAPEGHRDDDQAEDDESQPAGGLFANLLQHFGSRDFGSRVGGPDQSPGPESGRPAGSPGGPLAYQPMPARS